MLKNNTYRQVEFGRREQVSLGDFQIWIVSREDLILSELNWAKESRSEMQLNDVHNLLVADTDVGYLRRHAPELGVEELLKEVLADDVSNN